MASIGSLSSTTSSSVFNTNRRITGLASGLDTDALIESMTLSTRTKIAKQEQQKQLLQWKMDDYRSISSKLIAFQNKYTSYSSSTNLRSPGFFDRSLITALGENSKYISVSGTSDIANLISINAVKQLAKNTSYVSSTAVSDQTLNSGSVTGSETFTGSKLEGTYLSLSYGSQSYALYLPGGKEYATADEVVEALNSQLSQTEYGSDGTMLDSKIKFSLDADNKIVLDFASEEVASAGNSITIKGGSKDLLDALGFEKDMTASGDRAITGAELTEDHLVSFQTKSSFQDMISGEGKILSFRYNGTTKSIDLSKMDENIFDADGNADMTKLADYLEDELADAFGSGRIRVEYTGGALSFQTMKVGTNEVDNSSVLELSGGSSSVIKALGMTAGDSNRINMETSVFDSGLAVKNGDYTLQNSDTRNDYAIHIRNNNTGRIVTISQTVDGKAFDENTSLSDIIEAINASDGKVNVTYSETSDKFTLTSTDPGASGDFSIVGGYLDADGNYVESDDDTYNLGQAIFGKNVGDMDANSDYTVTKGQDAIIYVDYDGEGGEDPVELTRSSNTFDIDGLSVTVSKTFGMNEDNTAIDPNGDPVTFNAQVDVDKITEAVKSMIDDFNEIIELSNTELTEKRDRDYQPLTDEQREEMTEDQIKAWEEKAKAGMLFNDSDLRSFTSSIRFLFSGDSNTIQTLSDMGITTSSSYADHGKITFDETKFRAALEADPQSVSDVFTRTESTTVDSNGNTVTIQGGIMNNIKEVFDKYASTTGAVKGVFVQLAGATESPLSMLNNSILNQMNSIDREIERLQEKLEAETERYYSQFTTLETYISQMNSQSSWLSSQFSSY